MGGNIAFRAAAFPCVAALSLLLLNGCAIEPYVRADATGAEAGARVEWQKLGEEIRAAVVTVEAREAR